MQSICYTVTMKRIAKSHCPVNFALETVGDSWSMLIVRDIVFGGKKTHGEFLRSEEKIATNILAQRLTHLVEVGILIKKPHAADKRKDLYELTDKGLDLIPILFELSYWGTHHDSQTTGSKEFAEAAYAKREAVLMQLRETVKEGGSLFNGSDSVISKIDALSSTLN